jgi:hypothetical protein
MPPPQNAAALTAHSTAGPGVSSVSSGASKKEIRPGMTAAEVRSLLGKPKEEVVFGAKSLWTYPAYTVVFESGKVVEVKF